MGLFSKAKERLGNKLQGAIQDGKNRAIGEINTGVNRINGLLNPNARTGANMPGREESLYYPLDRSPDNPRGDRTAYWLKIEAQETKTLTAANTLGLERGVEVIREQETGITTKTIWLYMPSMTQNDSIAVDETELGVMGRAAASAIQNSEGGIMSGLGAAVDQGMTQMASTVSDLRSGNSPSIGTIATAIGLSKDIPVVKKVSNTVSATVGITKDPHAISLFQKVNLRAHDFSFNFVPTSAAEGQQVSAIIRFFRTVMYPVSVKAKDAFPSDYEITGAVTETTESNTDLLVPGTTAGEIADVSVAFIHPNTFRLSAWRVNEDGEMVSLAGSGLFYKECILEAVATDFDPNKSLAQRPDGGFPATNMSLKFKEIETLNRQDIRLAYEGNEV